MRPVGGRRWFTVAMTVMLVVGNAMEPLTSTSARAQTATQRTRRVDPLQCRFAGLHRADRGRLAYTTDTTWASTGR